MPPDDDGPAFVARPEVLGAAISAEVDGGAVTGPPPVEICLNPSVTPARSRSTAAAVRTGLNRSRRVRAFGVSFGSELTLGSHRRCHLVRYSVEARRKGIPISR
jgi:hypothetical protein